jgi:hypothetical protein
MLACPLACGPSVDEPEPLGTLEYGSYAGGWYREERRIEFVPDPEHGFSPPECAYLTQSAERRIEDALAALDPTIDYGFLEEDCSYQDGLFTKVYVDDLEHSPFACGMFCCRSELVDVSWTYLHAGSNLAGEAFEIDGERQVVIDLDRACEE